MEFGDFAARASAIEDATADEDVTALVAGLLTGAGDDLRAVARFVQGRVVPAWESTTLDVGPALCREALARAAGPNVTAADVEARLVEVGEIGAVAEDYDLGGQRGLGAFGGGGADPLTVAGVEDALRNLATTEGSGSRGRKLDRLFGLFSRAGPLEARYLARLVLGEMRLGVGEGTVRDATAEAFEVPVEAVSRALQVTNDCGRVAVLAREEGKAGLASVGLEVGRPVKAMLAQAGSIADALDRWGEAAVETKYDGARVQVHCGEEMRVFSRNMADVTDALPEVVEFVERRVDAPAILDGEVVAVERASGDGDAGDDGGEKSHAAPGGAGTSTASPPNDDEEEGGDPLPFQEVLRRFRRKHDVERAREEVAVAFHAFDCLHAGGDDLLDAPLRERHDRLRALLGEGPGLADLTVTDDPDAVATAERDALDAGHEGIMLKDPESAYTPGRRGRNWLKCKPDVETLDLVVTGAAWGEGRRANHLGTFLLAARDGDGFATIGKVATGISDEKLAALTDRLEPEVVASDGTEVEIRPAVVFEVGYEEIQRSPAYSSGYALRFPRFVSVREDKDPADADTLARVERLAGGDDA